MRRYTLFLVLFFCTCKFIIADFTEPFVISSEGNFKLSSHGRHNMIVSENGDIFITYWNENGTVSPENPSQVYVQKRSAARSWQEPSVVSNSFGARHSSLLLTADRLHLFWHDYRHCSELSSWMNQVEIYADSCLLDEYPDFENNIRVTRADNGHAGNNRFVPVPALDVNEDEISLFWYDFHLHGQISDIFFTQTSNKEWVQTDEHASLALTAFNGERAPYTMPDAVIHEDKIFITWTDTTGWKGNLYYGIKSGENFQYTSVAFDTAGYFDPPRIFLIDETPHILAAEFNKYNESAIVVFKMETGEPSVAEKYELTGFNGRCSQPVLWQSDEEVFIAWIRDYREIEIARFEYPSWNKIHHRHLFQETFSDMDMKVSLTGNTGGIVYLLWNYRGDIYFCSSELQTGIPGYNFYK